MPTQSKQHRRAEEPVSDMPPFEDATTVNLRNRSTMTVEQRLTSIASRLEAARREVMEAMKDADHDGETRDLHQGLALTASNLQDLSARCVEINESEAPAEFPPYEGNADKVMRAIRGGGDLSNWQIEEATGLNELEVKRSLTKLKNGGFITCRFEQFPDAPLKVCIWSVAS